MITFFFFCLGFILGSVLTFRRVIRIISEYEEHADKNDDAILAGWLYRIKKEISK